MRRGVAVWVRGHPGIALELFPYREAAYCEPDADKWANSGKRDWRSGPGHGRMSSLWSQCSSADLFEVCPTVMTAGPWQWKCASALECVTTHWPNCWATTKDGAVAACCLRERPRCGSVRALGSAPPRRVLGKLGVGSSGFVPEGHLCDPALCGTLVLLFMRWSVCANPAAAFRRTWPVVSIACGFEPVHQHW